MKQKTTAVYECGASRDGNVSETRPLLPTSNGVTAVEGIDSLPMTVKSRQIESLAASAPAADLIGRAGIPRGDRTIRLPVVSLAELCRLTPDEPAWLWRGYLAPETVTLLAGRPKSGKSTLMFALVAAVAAGVPFLGLETRAASVLILSEEPRSTIKEKAVRFGLAQSRTIEIVSRHEVRGRPWRAVVAAAIARCKQQGIDLLVVDTLNHWAGLPEDSENKAGAMMAAVEPLLEAADAGLAVLALVHQRKSPGSHGEALRGSNALPGSVEVVAELERVGRNGPVRALYADSRFQTATPAELFLELTEQGYLVRGSAEVRTNRDRARVLEALQKAKTPMSAEDLAKATGLPKATVYALLKGWGAVKCCGGTGARGAPRLYEPVDDSGEPHGHEDA